MKLCSIVSIVLRFARSSVSADYYVVNARKDPEKLEPVLGALRRRVHMPRMKASTGITTVACEHLLFTFQNTRITFIHQISISVRSSRKPFVNNNP